MIPNGWSRPNRVRSAVDATNVFARRVEQTLRKHRISLRWLLLAPDVVLFFANASYGPQTSLPVFDVLSHAARSDQGSPLSSHDVAYRLRKSLEKR